MTPSSEASQGCPTPANASRIAEVQVVLDGEIIEDKPSWEQLTSEWAEGTRLELAGQLRQARAAANVGRHYGRASMKAFAREVGCSKSKVYSYAKVWVCFGHIFESDSPELSTRLETLGISHLIASLADPDPVSMATLAHDEDLSVRQIGERISDKEENGKAEVVETRVCPLCNGAGEVPVE